MPAKTKTSKRIKPVIEEVSEVEDQPTAEANAQEESSTETVTQVEPATTPAIHESEPVSSHPEPAKPRAEEKKMNLKLIVIITLVSAIVAAFVSGGVYVYLSGLESLSNKSKDVYVPTDPDPELLEEPLAGEETEPEDREVDFSEYSIQVLNGSGRIGAAGALEAVLAKHKIEVASTGNASRYNYAKTSIQAKQSVSATAISKLESLLADEGYETEVQSLPLAASAAHDIQIIVGAN